MHNIIFCHTGYKHLMDDCLQSIHDNVLDEISSTTIVSNSPILIPGTNNILDRDLWEMIDPAFKYSDVYKLNWVKQQILKLNLDKIADGPLLVTDADVICTNPLRWQSGKKNKLFYRSTPMPKSENFVKKLIDVDSTVGYITNNMIFQSDVLASLRNFLEEKFQKDQIEIYRDAVLEDTVTGKIFDDIFMSEHQLYNDYFVKNYPNRVWKSEKFKMKEYWTFKKVSNENLSYNHKDTLWLSFYESVRGTDWPDCYYKNDFKDLPQWIQDECTNVHGYKL